MPRGHRIDLLCVLAALSSLGVPACGPAGASGTEALFDRLFQVGSATPASIAADSAFIYDDPVSGRTFVFPEGGHGTLTISPISEGPERPYSGGEGYRIEWSGAEPVHLRLPDTDGADYVLGFGIFEGAGNFDVAEGRWNHVPSSTKADGILTFDLPLVYQAPVDLEEASGALDGNATATYALSAWRGFLYYWLVAVTPDSTDVENQQIMVRTAEDFINHWMEALPPAVQAQALEANAGRLRPRYFYDENYYAGFDRPRLGTVTPSSRLGLVIRAEPPEQRASGIAHEVGHYMNHVLAGDDRYRIIEDRAPDEKHGILARLGRGTVTEEYAYLSEYYLLGVANTVLDPTNPFQMFGGSKRPLPIDVDYPGIEGFGCMLLAALHRSEAQVFATVSGLREPAPVVGASFGEIASVIAQGAADTMALRGAVEAFLAGRAQADLLPVLAERIGWSYRTRGRLIDADGNGLAGARVRSIARAGGQEYGMQAADFDTTGVSGGFILERTFPGVSILRVEHGGQTSDVPISVDWALPTNTTVELKNLTVGATVQPECMIGLGCSISAVVAAVYDNGMTVNDYVTVPSVGGSVTGTRFDGSRHDGAFDLTIVVQLDDTCDAVTSFEVSGSTTDYPWIALAGGLVPESPPSGLGTRYWQLAGSATCGSLHTVAKTAADGFATIASWSCNEASLIRIECAY